MSEDALSQIERLHSLKERGVLTDAEFEAKKFALLRDSVAFVPPTASATVTMGTDWRGLVSMILGILSAMGVIAINVKDRDSVDGLGIVAVVGLVLGIFALCTKPPRGARSMAVTGVTLTSIALLGVLGVLAGP